jgi:hypothetical protein
MAYTPKGKCLDCGKPCGLCSPCGLKVCKECCDKCYACEGECPDADHPEKIKQEIIQLHSQGLGVRKISQELHYPLGIVAYVISKSK